MSLVQVGDADLPSPALVQANSLSSNNPFRNRAASPGISTGQPSPQEVPPRPLSRNPFLDSSTIDRRTQKSPDRMLSPTRDAAPPTALRGNAAELFNNLTLNDKTTPAHRGMISPPPRSSSGTGEALPPPYSAAQRRENLPPRAPPGHRPSKSQEEAMRARRAATGSSAGRPGRTGGGADIFADPPESSATRKSSDRRPRRNSDSSAMDRHAGLLDPEEEKKKQERRRRERKHREREAKDGKSKKPDRKLDVIDKLDVTSIYGTGLFHHDGPFDACNPHRNRQGSKRAPMQAFPKDSLNNVLGGGGPLNKRPDHATFLGHSNDEAFKDYSKGGAAASDLEPYSNGAVRPEPTRQESHILSATTRVEPIHGEETLGLGTSTFLEGAPASRTAMQRRESENAGNEGGLSRKKSLAQKIRGINATRRDYGPSGRVTSPDGIYSPEARTPGGTKIESNPFFNEFTQGDDTITTAKKDGNITIVEPTRPTTRARAPSSPGTRLAPGALERRATNDDAAPRAGGGFLARVKSLKGPRKLRAQSGSES